MYGSINRRNRKPKINGDIAAKAISFYIIPPNIPYFIPQEKNKLEKKNRKNQNLKNKVLPKQNR